MGPYLGQPQITKTTSIGNKNNISYCSSQMQGWRKNMQDASIHTLDIGDGNSVFAVFDGHGGHQVSKYVSQIFINILKSSPHYLDQKYDIALQQTFKKIDQKINSDEGNRRLKQIRNQKNNTNSILDTKIISNQTGCTANVLLITNNKFIVANAGDSRSSLCKKGKAYDLSQDHKPSNPGQQQRINKAGGMIHMGRINGGLNLSRSFGDFDYKRNLTLQYHQQMVICKPDIKIQHRTSDDEFIVMGCDGIWQKYVTNSQGLIDMVRDQIKSKKQHKKIVQDLLDHLLAKNTDEGVGCDNMTAILITFK